MSIVFCLECARVIRLRRVPVEGQIITCSSCGIQLEVVDVNPPELDWATAHSEQEHEDWEWWKGNKDRILEREFDFP